MKKNLGIDDRIIRFVVMDLLLGFSYLGFDVPPIYTFIAFLLSILLALTILFGYSPIYHIFGLSTRQKIKKKDIGKT